MYTSGVAKNRAVSSLLCHSGQALNGAPSFRFEEENLCFPAQREIFFKFHFLYFKMDSIF